MKPLFYIGIALILWAGCKDPNNITPPPNPFDPYDSIPTQTGNQPTVDPKTFAGIHHTVFRPTCANSGCHDGTFEPDFRTVESSYNTLVYHPIIKNNPQNSFQYRVVPGNPDASQLWERLNHDIDGQSGIMPLVLDPESDWDSKKTEYLANIRAWIQNGAKDMFGNPPANGNLQPYMRGLVALANGNPLGRDVSSGVLIVPAGANNVDLLFAFGDDNSAPQDLQNNQVKFSTAQNDFSQSQAESLTLISPVSYLGYFGTLVDYTHKCTLNLSAYPTGSLIYVRAYVKDPALSNITEIPGNGSPTYIKLYFALKK